MKIADLLLQADRLAQSERCDDAAALLVNAMAASGPRAKPRIIDRLRALAAKNTTTACNLGLALVRGDGIPVDSQRGAGLLKNVLDNGDPMAAAVAHNFLGHFYRGGFGTEPNMPCALSHFEEAGQLGDGEAAFNAGLFLDRGAAGIAKDAARPAANYRHDVAHGSAMAMTNLALSMLAGEVRDADPGEAIDLLEQASILGDAQAAAVLLLIDAESTTLARVSQLSLDSGNLAARLRR